MTQDLRIHTLEFHDFRNYESLLLSDLAGLTVFVGRNAVGKTNILEGIQLLTSAHSFRHPQVMQLVRDTCPYARVQMEMGDGNRQVITALYLEQGKKRFTVNGKPKAAADVRGLLPSVMFTPDDLELAKKSSSVKREALDDLGAQLNRSYYIVRRDYEKTLRYKNRLLKEEASKLLVESINETLVTCGSQLYCFRKALFNRLVPIVVRNYAELSRNGEPFSAFYTPSWKRGEEEVGSLGEDQGDSGSNEGTDLTRDEVKETLEMELERSYEEEKRRGRSIIGPHNDVIGFEVAGRDATTYASQGQQRCIVLAWKLAEVTVTRDILGVNPVLLLDDVMSELDASRRDMLVTFVTEDIQTFVTATDLSGFNENLLTRANVVSLPLGE